MSVSGLARFWRCPAPRLSFRSSRGRRGLTPSGPPASLPGTSSVLPSLRTCWVSTCLFRGRRGLTLGEQPARLLLTSLCFGSEFCVTDTFRPLCKLCIGLGPLWCRVPLLPFLILVSLYLKIQIRILSSIRLRNRNRYAFYSKIKKWHKLYSVPDGILMT